VLQQEAGGALKGAPDGIRLSIRRLRGPAGFACRSGCRRQTPGLSKLGTLAAGALDRVRDAASPTCLPCAAGLVWDDDAHVTRPELRSLDGLRRIWFELGATQQYYPLLHSAFWLEHRLWGDSVVGYHLANILLHAAAACLVVAIMRRLALPGAWLAGLIFALHPVNVESVAWISEQKNTLSAVFCLGRPMSTSASTGTGGPGQYALGPRPLHSRAHGEVGDRDASGGPPGRLLLEAGPDRMEERRPAARPVACDRRRRGLFTAWVERSYAAQGTGDALGWPERLLLPGASSGSTWESSRGPRT
jgi:hypothetical protein